MTDETKRIPLRVPADLCKRVDAWRERWAKSAIGVVLSRNQALVMLLERGLAGEKGKVRR